MVGKEATQQGVSRRDQMMADIIKQRADEKTKESGREPDEKTKESGRESDEKAKESGRELDEKALAEEEMSAEEDVEEEEIKEEEDASDIGDQEDKEESRASKNTVSIVGTDGRMYEIPADGRVKLKIDGEEIEETIDSVMRAHQKGAAGDRRLQQASEMMHVLEQRATTLSRREQEFLRRMKAADTDKAKGALSPDEHKEKAKKLVDALLDADEDTAAQILGEAFSGSQPKQDIDLNAVGKMVNDKVNEITKAKELEDAQERFKKEYKNLHDDRYLFNLVDAETLTVMAETPSATPWEIIDKAAKRISNWRSTNKQVKPKPSIRRPPTPASGRAVIGKDIKPKMREDILREMRESRGQPV